MDTLLITNTNHQNSIKAYLNWVFKDKKDYVILRSYVNHTNNTTKVFMVLPVKERIFVTDTDDVFKPETLINTDFPHKDKQLIRYKTIYTGNMDEFYNFPKYISNFNITVTVPNANFMRYSTKEEYRLYRDYTVTKQRQCENFSQIKAFMDPADSVNSIYRLIQRKFVTVVELDISN